MMDTIKSAALALAKSRKVRKAVIEGLAAIALVAVGFLIDNPESVGGSAAVMWGLLQLRRVLRDWAVGTPD